MICWFGLVSAGVPLLVSLLLSSFFPQGRGSVPSWFAGSFWFRLWFRCLSPFFSLLSFLRKRVLFHHDLLVPPGSGWGSGACLLCSLFFGSGACLPSSLFFLSSGQGFCSIMICWFFLFPAGVPVLVSLLLSSLVPVLVSLLLSSFFPQERGSVPSWFAGSSWFRLGFRCLPPLASLLLSSFFPQERGSVPSWFAGSSWFRLGFRCLSPFFSLLWLRCLSPFFALFPFLRTRVLFHHDLLVLPGSGWGSGACLPSSLFFGSDACLPSSLFFLFSGKGFCSIMICWLLLVPAGVPVLVSLLLSSLVPMLVSLLLSSFFSQENGSVPSWISWFLLLGAGVPVLVSLLLDFWRLGLNVSPLPIWLLLTPSMRCIEMDGHGCSQILWFFWNLLRFQTLSNRQPDGSLQILIDLFHGQLCLFSRKSHGLVLALLFSREKQLVPVLDSSEN